MVANRYTTFMSMTGSPLTVATTGTWNIHPNVYNAVPRGASILLDIRDVDFDRRQQVIDAVLTGAKEIGEKWKTPSKAEVVYAHPPIISSEVVSLLKIPLISLFLKGMISAVIHKHAGTGYAVLVKSSFVLSESEHC